MNILRHFTASSSSSVSSSSSSVSSSSSSVSSSSSSVSSSSVISSHYNSISSTTVNYPYNIAALSKSPTPPSSASMFSRLRTSSAVISMMRFCLKGWA
eukprot:Em0005g1238a